MPITHPNGWNGPVLLASGRLAMPIGCTHSGRTSRRPCARYVATNQNAWTSLRSSGSACGACAFPSSRGRVFQTLMSDSEMLTPESQTTHFGENRSDSLKTQDALKEVGRKGFRKKAILFCLYASIQAERHDRRFEEK